VTGDGRPGGWTARGKDSGTFTSALSVADFAAMRPIGFEPVGQVMGSAVFRFRHRVVCGSWRYGPTSVLNRIPPPWRTADARHRAVARMRAECAHLGGQGVVGVRVTTRRFLGRTVEFSAIGTAIRLGRGSPVDQASTTPFATDLSGPECAKLVGAGWRPAGLVMGHGAAIRHEWRGVVPGSWGEIRAATELVHAARTAARGDLGREARRFPGATVLARGMTLDARKLRCYDEGHDHLVEAFIVGTAIVPLDREPTAERARAGAAPLVMMRLNGPARHEEADA
jgi:uncharacterized protein YbjQ (UPF0145 family)